jgi:hypothetical protein
MTTTVFYPAGTARGGIAYRAPQHLRLSSYAGPGQGQQVRVQVRRTACQWRTTFRRVVCGSALWDDGFVAQQATYRLLAGLLPRATFTRATTAADGRAGMVRITISAPEAPPLCAPWQRCPGTRYDPHGRYLGILLVSASNGLPLSFGSAVTVRGRTFAFQRVSFSYARLAPIRLPAGRHIACTSSTPGQWCLVRK